MEYDPQFDPVATAISPGESSSSPDQGELTPTPTTWLLVGMWVVVYLAMTIYQGGFRSGMGSLGPGVIATPVAHEFGALRAREVISGEVWRTITATFIHLSLLHLVCNLSCLIAFGRVLDSWYGGPQFFAVYLAIAALGNGFAVVGRYFLKSGLDTTCAGGSSVMFGLIALMAVVGWRARTRFGDFIRRKMVGKLIIFGLIMGFVGRNVLDNYGHAGGALAGAIVGLGHKRLIAWWDRTAARWIACGISALVMLACVVFQAKAGRSEYLDRMALEKVKETQTLARRAVLFRLLADNVTLISLRYAQMGQLIQTGRGPYKTDPTIPFRHDIGVALNLLDRLPELGTPGGDPERFSKWHEMAVIAVKKQPNKAEVLEFRRLSRSLQQDIADEMRGLPSVVIKPQTVPAPKAR